MLITLIWLCIHVSKQHILSHKFVHLLCVNQNKIKFKKEKLQVPFHHSTMSFLDVHKYLLPWPCLLPGCPSLTVRRTQMPCSGAHPFPKPLQPLLVMGNHVVKENGEKSPTTAHVSAQGQLFNTAESPTSQEVLEPEPAI